MATLQELENDFLAIQNNVKALKKQMPAKSELKNFYYYVITYIIEIFLLDKSKIAGLFSMFSGGFYGI